MVAIDFVDLLVVFRIIFHCHTDAAADEASWKGKAADQLAKIRSLLRLWAAPLHHDILAARRAARRRGALVAHHPRLHHDGLDPSGSSRNLIARAAAEDGGLLLRELLLREDALRLHFGKLLQLCQRSIIHGGRC